MTTERHHARLAFMISTAVIFTYQQSASGRERARLTITPIVAESLKETADIVSDRDRIATNLVAGLCDTNCAPAARIACARWLGRLHYVEAIRTIIDHMDLGDPDGASTGADVLGMWPCLQVLVDYGVAAMPELAEEWMKEADARRRAALYIALSNIKRNEVVRTYVKGLVAQAKDKESRDKASALLHALENP